MAENDVAQYMNEQLKKNGNMLYQEDIAYDIKSKYGDGYVYENENGNLAINKKVLKKFKEIRDSDVEWDKSEKCWLKQ